MGTDHGLSVAITARTSSTAGRNMMFEIVNETLGAIFSATRIPLENWVWIMAVTQAALELDIGSDENHLV